MRPADIADLLKGLAIDVREYIAQALAPVSKKQAELEDRIAAVVATKGDPGTPGPSAYQIALESGFVGSESDWLASLCGPPGESIKGDRGDDGQSVTLDDIAPLLRDELAKQVAEFPRPKDGTSITVDDVQPLLRELVDAAVGALPTPASGQDGKSVTVDDVRPLIDEAVEAIPPGKSLTAEDVRPLVQELVDAAAAVLPVPKDGTSVTLEDLLPLVEQAVAAVPIQVPTVDDLTPMVRELVDAAAAAIPAPAPGKDGQSVTVDDVRPLVEQLVASIPKPKDGENVPIEVVAALVGGEVAKAVGALPRPQDGNDGRDAAAIEPLPAIDPARSYPRGTWAKHQRGLWLARTATDGMTGWDCIVAGVAALEMTSDGLRTVTVKSILSDGQSESAEFVLPTMVYRGIWTAGAYEPGDTTSWDGSTWHCEEKTTDRPGTSAAWRLCVKRGRDGKDGLRGTRGERGPDGKPGRDYNGNRT